MCYILLAVACALFKIIVSVEFHVIYLCHSKGLHQPIHFAKHHRFSCSFPNKMTTPQASTVVNIIVVR